MSLNDRIIIVFQFFSIECQNSEVITHSDLKMKFSFAIIDSIAATAPKFINNEDSLSRPYHFKFFKGCLPQILLGPNDRILSLNVKYLLILQLFSKKNRDYSKGAYFLLRKLFLCVFKGTIYINMVGLLLNPF